MLPAAVIAAPLSVSANSQVVEQGHALPSAELDQLTAQVLDAMASGHTRIAAEHAAALATRFPTFGLGQLLHAELQANLAGMPSLLDNAQASYTSTLMNLLLEAQTRLQHAHNSDGNVPYPEGQPADLPAPGIEHYPAEILQLGPHIKHVVLVDLEQSELFLFRAQDGRAELSRRHYIASGSGGFGKQVEGDLKTPLGIYSINGFRSDESLPNLYGSGALMLDYPNDLDRLMGRTGSGIWLHGVPHDQMSRSPRSSEGCVTMGNDYLLDLEQQLDLPATHVILGRSPEWLSADVIDQRRERYRELFEQYRDAWVNQQTGDLLSLYADSALPNGLTRQVATHSMDAPTTHPGGYTAEHLKQLSADDISILQNPTLHTTEQHIVMSLSGVGPRKGGTITLYWGRNSANQWHIVRETVTSSGA